MEWRDLLGKTIVSVVATRKGKPDETIPNVLHLRFEDGSAVLISCEWASTERPWLGLAEDPEADDLWLASSSQEGDPVASEADEEELP